MGRTEGCTDIVRPDPFQLSLYPTFAGYLAENGVNTHRNSKLTKAERPMAPKTRWRTVNLAPHRTQNQPLHATKSASATDLPLCVAMGVFGLI